MIRLFIVCVCVLLVKPAFSCDVCGAVNSSLGLGTVAAGNRHSIGLVYQYRTYDSHHPPLFNEPAINSSERFQRIDLTGTIRLADRWQLKAILPYSVGTQSKNGTTTHKSGPGDATLTAHYFIIDRQDSLFTKSMRWSIGTGIKSPLGNYPLPDDELLLLYPGTGSWDGVFQSSFYFRKNNWALIQENNFILRTTNKYHYTPGSLFSATLYGMRRFSNWSLFGGFQYAWNGIDYLNRSPINSSPSQGNILSTTLGATIQWGNIMLQANYHLPIVQQLGNGYVDQKQSFTAGIHYIFNN